MSERSPATERAEGTGFPLRRPRRLLPEAPLWEQLAEFARRREAWEDELRRLGDEYCALEAELWELLAQALFESHLHQATSEPETGPLDLVASLARYERSLIQAALARAGGCQRRAAAELGMLPTTLNEKLRRFGLAAARHPRRARD